MPPPEPPQEEWDSNIEPLRFPWWEVRLCLAVLAFILGVATQRIPIPAWLN